MKKALSVLLVVAFIGTSIAEAGNYGQYQSRGGYNSYRGGHDNYRGNYQRHSDYNNYRGGHHSSGVDPWTVLGIWGGVIIVDSLFRAATQPQVVYVQQPAPVYTAPETRYYSEPEYSGPQTNCKKYLEREIQNGVVVKERITERCDSSKTEHTY